MMRTLTTLLLLVCFAWSQAAAAHCPRADQPDGQADVHADASHSPHGHHAPAPAPTGDDGERHPPAPAHHAASGCGVVMSCGAAATPSSAAPLAAHFADAVHGMGADRGRYASPTLSTEPPPPRIALRS